MVATAVWKCDYDLLREEPEEVHENGSAKEEAFKMRKAHLCFMLIVVMLVTGHALGEGAVTIGPHAWFWGMNEQPVSPKGYTIVTADFQQTENSATAGNSVLVSIGIGSVDRKVIDSVVAFRVYVHGDPDIMLEANPWAILKGYDKNFTVTTEYTGNISDICFCPVYAETGEDRSETYSIKGKIDLSQWPVFRNSVIPQYAVTLRDTMLLDTADLNYCLSQEIFMIPADEQVIVLSSGPNWSYVQCERNGGTRGYVHTSDVAITGTMTEEEQKLLSDGIFHPLSFGEEKWTSGMDEETERIEMNSDAYQWTEIDVNSEGKAISRAKEVYFLRQINLDVDDDRLNWSAYYLDDGGWYVVTVSDPGKAAGQDVVKHFNVKVNGETGAIHDWWFQKRRESGKKLDISNYVITKELQRSLAETLIQFIEAVSPSDAKLIDRWDLSMMADVEVHGAVHHIACFAFYDEHDGYVGDIWTDLDDQDRIIQMELTSTGLG